MLLLLLLLLHCFWLGHIVSVRESQRLLGLLIAASSLVSQAITVLNQRPQAGSTAPQSPICVLALAFSALPAPFWSQG